MYEELYSWRDSRGGTGRTVAEYGRKHLLMYAELARRSIASADWQGTGWVMWRVYPKHHALQHTLEDQ
eukprot:8364966-Pyramimonas_sp.AAC.1